MEFNDTGRKFAVLYRSGRFISVLTGTFDRIVESPVFCLALTALHEETFCLIERGDVFLRIFGGEVHVFFGHTQFGPDAVEAEIHIGFCKTEREVEIGGFAVNDPFIHAPEMAVFEAEVHCVDHLGNERKLFSRSYRAANTAGIVCRGLLPYFDVFEGFCTIKFLKCIKNIDFEAGAFIILEGVDRDFGGIIEEFFVQCGVIPPFGRDF